MQAFFIKFSKLLKFYFSRPTVKRKTSLADKPANRLSAWGS